LRCTGSDVDDIRDPLCPRHDSPEPGYGQNQKVLLLRAAESPGHAHTCAPRGNNALHLRVLCCGFA